MKQIPPQSFPPPFVLLHLWTEDPPIKTLKGRTKSKGLGVRFSVVNPCVGKSRYSFLQSGPLTNRIRSLTPADVKLDIRLRNRYSDAYFKDMVAFFMQGA